MKEISTRIEREEDALYLFSFVLSINVPVAFGGNTSVIQISFPCSDHPLTMMISIMDGRVDFHTFSYNIVASLRYFTAL